MLPLPNAELAVMELLWRKGRLTSRDIMDELYRDAARPQHGTVQRLLQRLEDKGYVARDRDLGVNAFTPTLSRESYATGQLEVLAERLTGGSLAPMLTRLVEHNKLPRPEIERLRRILEDQDE